MQLISIAGVLLVEGGGGGQGREWREGRGEEGVGSGREVGVVEAVFVVYCCVLHFVVCN